MEEFGEGTLEENLEGGLEGRLEGGFEGWLSHCWSLAVAGGPPSEAGGQGWPGLAWPGGLLPHCQRLP